MSVIMEPEISKRQGRRWRISEFMSMEFLHMLEWNRRRGQMQPSALTEKIIANFLRMSAVIGLSKEEVAVGGGSGGNLIAPLNLPLIDGMGMRGGNANTMKEFADASKLPLDMNFLCKAIMSMSETLS